MFPLSHWYVYPLRLLIYYLIILVVEYHFNGIYIFDHFLSHLFYLLCQLNFDVIFCS